MIRKGKLKFLTLTLMSAGLTAGVYFLDQHRSTQIESSAALRWAHQVVTQAESLELAGREKGEKDPLNWAIETLAQGSEPRLMIVRRISPEADLKNETETFQLDRRIGVFYYSKVMNPRDGSGIRITLDLRTSGIIQGFLGTHTQLTEDTAIFSIFFAFLLLFWGLTFLFKRKTQNQSPEVNNSLHSLGIEIRNLLKQAHAMAVATRHTKVASHGLREKIHQSLTQLHSNQKSLRDLTLLIQQAEKAAIQAHLNESNRSQFLEVMKKIKELSKVNEQTFRELEIQIEPCVIDADLSDITHQEAVATAEKMGLCIQKTREQLAHHIEVHRLKALATK